MLFGSPKHRPTMYLHDNENHFSYFQMLFKFTRLILQLTWPMCRFLIVKEERCKIKLTLHFIFCVPPTTIMNNIFSVWRQIVNRNNKMLGWKLYFEDKTRRKWKEKCKKNNYYWIRYIDLCFHIIKININLCNIMSVLFYFFSELTSAFRILFQQRN